MNNTNSLPSFSFIVKCNKCSSPMDITYDPLQKRKVFVCVENKYHAIAFEVTEVEV